ncbi:hypothetical protein [Ellagibacter isourolithinifaciens]|uniref:hypothetical protein n=1 Tax=Ellagibacter isourolithinifaciens TaxID=2137581 RepID=UPI003AAF1785
MRATVTYPYRDRETLEVHRTGDEVELTAERFAELSAAGYVDAPEQAGEPAEPAPEKAAQPEEPAEPAPEEPARAEHEPPREMTAAQLRAEIEARGGFAPKKATKAQLAELLEQL